MLLQVFLLLLGGGVGWAASSPFNRAKLARLVGKQKKVVFVVNSKGRARDFVIDAPVTDKLVEIEVKPFLSKTSEKFSLYPNSIFDGEWKTIPFGVFDGRDFRQIPLSQYTHFAGKNENGEIVWLSNEEVLGNLVPPVKVQNIISTQTSSERLKARSEVNQNEKLMMNLVKIAVGASVITLFVVFYVAIQTGAITNLLGGVANNIDKVASAPANFTAT